MGGCGKDTFAKVLNEFIPTKKYSSIDVIKDIAKMCGWTGGKTEKDRKFLSDLKKLVSDYSDLPFLAVSTQVEWFKFSHTYEVLLIDIREPENIKRAVEAFGARTILIDNTRTPYIASNDSDSRVFDYDYDIVILNNGSLEELRESVRIFVELHLK